jgi:hypothetical protein
MARLEAGYTLVELVVVIGIFTVVMTLISTSFNRIVASSGQIVKSVETDIGGLIGLELLRSDLESAGFGLPWSFPSGSTTFTYEEVRAGALVVEGVDASLFNDRYPRAPRAYVTGDDQGYNGSDYLVLKGTSVGMNEVCRKWSYLTYSSTGAVVKASKSEVELKPGNNDSVVVIKTGITAGGSSRELVTNGFGSSSFSLLFNKPLPDGFQPKSKQDSYMVYGVAEKNNDGKPVPLSFPYNRADYYISRKDDISKTCATGTGVLYKTVINQSGSLTWYPLLDCVADLQVSFMLDGTSNDGSLVAHKDIYRETLKGLFGITMTDDQADQALRAHMKGVIVYVLAQQGKKDAGYRFPASQIKVGDHRTWSQSELAAKLGADWMQYHWKVYTIAVQPKNLD